MKKIIIALSIAVLTFVNSVSALTATEVQETLKKEFFWDNSKVIKVNDSFGGGIYDFKINTVYDFGVVLSLHKTGIGHEICLVGFDGSVNFSPIVFNNGFAIVQCGEKWGVINGNYEWKLPPVFDITYPYLGDPHLPFINDFALLEYGDKYFIINSKCEIVDSVSTDQFLPMPVDTSTIVCYNSDTAYMWHDNRRIELEYPEDSGRIIFEYNPYKINNGFVVGEEKPLKYHVYDTNGKLKYSFDCREKIGEGEISQIELLVNGGACIGVEKHKPVICDGNGNIIKNPGYAPSGPFCTYDNYIWEDSFNNLYCYDERMTHVFRWDFAEEERLLVGSSEDYIAFITARLEESKEVPGAYLTIPKDEIVVVIGEEANPMQKPHIADPKKIDELLNSAKDEISVFMNGGILKFDTNPIMVNDRVLVPMRKIFEEIGATVSWDEERQCAKAVKGDVTVEISIGESFFEKNGKQIPIDAPAQLENDRTLVPLRAVSEAFDLNVDWIEELNMVSIL